MNWSFESEDTDSPSSEEEACGNWVSDEFESVEVGGRWDWSYGISSGARKLIRTPELSKNAAERRRLDGESSKRWWRMKSKVEAIGVKREVSGFEIRFMF